MWMLGNYLEQCDEGLECGAGRVHNSSLEKDWIPGMANSYIICLVNEILYNIYWAIAYVYLQKKLGFKKVIDLQIQNIKYYISRSYILLYIT